MIEVYPRENRLLIEKLNMIKRHTKPNQQLRQGGIVEKEAPISASNVKLMRQVRQADERCPEGPERRDPRAGVPGL